MEIRFIKKIGKAPGEGIEIDRLFKDWSFTIARWPKSNENDF